MNITLEALNTLLHDSRYFYTISLDLNSVYNYVSPNYNKNFGSGRDTLLGQKFSVTLHPDDIDICTEAGYRCMENPDELIPVTLRKHDGQGGFVTTNWEMKAIVGKDNALLGVYCIGYNDSELVIAQDKLGHAETQLEEIGFIQSHVVRKPLANILGLVEILKVDGHSDEILDLLASSAQDFDKVVNEISEKTN